MATRFGGDGSLTAFAVAKIPRGPSCAEEGRRFAERELAGAVDRPVLERLNLVVSELLTNAYRHGEGPIQLRLAVAPDHARVEVVDAGSGAVPEIRDAAGEDGGWGLVVVGELARAWGVFEGTTHVWAEIPL